MYNTAFIPYRKGGYVVRTTIRGNTITVDIRASVRGTEVEFEQWVNSTLLNSLNSWANSRRIYGVEYTNILGRVIVVIGSINYPVGGIQSFGYNSLFPVFCWRIASGNPPEQAQPEQELGHILLTQTLPNSEQFLGNVIPNIRPPIYLGNVLQPYRINQVFGVVDLGAVSPIGVNAGTPAPIGSFIGTVPAYDETEIPPIVPPLPPAMVGFTSLGAVILRRNPPSPTLTNLYLGRVVGPGRDNIPPNLYLGRVVATGIGSNLPNNLYLGGVSSYSPGRYLGSVDAYNPDNNIVGLYLGSVDSDISYREIHLGEVQAEIELGTVVTRHAGVVGDTLLLGTITNIYRPTAHGWHMNIPKPSSDAGDYNLTTIVKGTLRVLPSLSGFDPADVFETEREISSPGGMFLYGKREEHLITLTAVDYQYSPLHPYEPNTDRLDLLLASLLGKATADPQHFIINIESEYPEYYRPLLDMLPGTPIVLDLRQDYDAVFTLIANRIKGRLSTAGLFTVRIDASNRL